MNAVGPSSDGNGAKLSQQMPSHSPAIATQHFSPNDGMIMLSLLVQNGRNKTVLSQRWANHRKHSVSRSVAYKQVVRDSDRHTSTVKYRQDTVGARTGEVQA